MTDSSASRRIHSFARAAWKSSSGHVDYAKFIALMLPPNIVKEDSRVMRKGKQAGPESLKASMHAMTDLTTEEILKVDS